MNRAKKAEIEKMGTAIAAFISDNVIGQEPISFEMYQKTVALIFGCRPDQVKRVYHKLDDSEENSLVADVVMDRPLEVITVVGEIR